MSDVYVYHAKELMHRTLEEIKQLPDVMVRVVFDELRAAVGSLPVLR